MAGLHVRTGDQVKVIAGKERSKTGKVLKIMPEKDRIVVEGLHMIKRAVKPDQKNPQGGFVNKEGTVHISNVMLVCSTCEQPTRVRKRVNDEGAKVRVCASCDADIDKG